MAADLVPEPEPDSLWRRGCANRELIDQTITG